MVRSFTRQPCDSLSDKQSISEILLFKAKRNPIVIMTKKNHLLSNVLNICWTATAVSLLLMFLLFYGKCCLVFCIHTWPHWSLSYDSYSKLWMQHVKMSSWKHNRRKHKINKCIYFSTQASIKGDHSIKLSVFANLCQHRDICIYIYISHKYNFYVE